VLVSLGLAAFENHSADFLETLLPYNITFAFFKTLTDSPTSLVISCGDLPNAQESCLKVWTAQIFKSSDATPEGKMIHHISSGGTFEIPRKTANELKHARC
jgi:hypothetical protein